MMKNCMVVLAALVGLNVFAARTVSISEQTASAVTFRFGAADGQAYGLYLAHGATDADDDKYGWADFVKIADVGANQTSLDYTVPEQYRDGGYVRFFLMQTEGLAIMKELAEVRSTSQQWVDIGIAPTGSTTVDFRFGKVTYQNQTTFFGQNWAGSRYLFNQQVASNVGKFHFHGSTSNTGVNVEPNTDYKMMVDHENNVYIFKNGAQLCKMSSGRGVGDGNFAVFCCNDGTHHATFAFYRFKIARVGSDNGRVIRDLVPAMDFNGEAGLYDYVNGGFYKSKTATPLVAGAERPAARFGRVVDETPTFCFHRSVAVSEISENAVTLAFGNPDGKVHKLFVAYGNADKDDDKNAWASFAEVGDIAADAMSYTYTLPAELKQEGVLYRFFIVQTTDLPYASELASIKSDGGQTIRIGYAPMIDTVADFRFGEVTYASSTTFFGQAWNASCYLFNMQGNTQFYFHSGGQALEGIAANTDYRCRVLPNDLIEISKSGSCNQTAISRLANPLCPFAVFGCYSVTHGSKFRFDSFKLKDDGLLVRDLVPVQTAAGKGALYDRVNNVVYGNETNSDFAKGAVVARQGRVLGTSGTVVAGAEQLPGFIRLTENTDLTGQNARLRDGTEIDLNGFTLKLTGDSTLAAKEFTLVGTPGTLDITVPSATEYAIGNFTCYANPSAIIKHGAGTLNLNVRLSGVPSIVVEEGMVKAGISSLMGDTTTVTVKNGAGYDMNGYADSNILLVIEGAGPDGKGALRNSRAAIGNGNQQIAGLTLTGDATIGGDYNFGLIRGGYAEQWLELNGHTLTFDLASLGVNFWMAHVTSTTSGTVYVKKGTLDFYNNSYDNNLPNVDFIIEGPNAKFNIDSSSYARNVNIRDITIKNGGIYNETVNVTHVLRNFTVLNSGTVGGGVAWTYTAGTITVSNETETVDLIPPFCDHSGSYPKLVKYGAGTLNIKNNHSEERIDRGVEIFGGTVVMDSIHANHNYHYAISSQYAPYIIHNGGTLDMRKCTAPVKMNLLVIEDGGTLLNNDSNAIEFAGGTTLTQPIAFSGSVTFPTGNAVWNLTDFFAAPGAPAAGTTITLLSAKSISGNCNISITGCPYPYDLLFFSDRIQLRTKTAAQAELAPIKIFSLGGDYIEGVANSRSFRQPLARNLSALGWNVKMPGWHKTMWFQANGLHTTDTLYWNFHSGVKDLALKTSASRAGVLEGLETYCMTAENPEFTIFVCGDIDVADHVADATVLANYKAAVTRIKAALPMTTVIASSIPGGSAQLNSDIAAWCGTEPDVEYIDLAAIFGSAKVTSANAETAATALTTLITSLATANGKNTPSTWTPPTVTFGAENNVPAAYLQGYTHVRTLDMGDKFRTRKYEDAVPYSFAPPMRKTGIVKAGYYVEMVHRVSGNHMAVWVDMDAPGSNWADVSLPIFASQTKQKTVHKLHVWSNSGAVSQVAADDDSVDGYIEFNSGNYAGGDRTGDVIAEPWPAQYGFNDTMTVADAGHGCFQVMRKFADANAFPAAEIIFAMNRFGANDTDNTYAFGIGTLADYANHGVSTSKSLDYTFTYGDNGNSDTDAGRLSTYGLATRRIEFWVKYEDDTPVSRASMANYQWKTDGDGQFWNLANWVSTADGTTAATSPDYSTYLFPEGGNYTPTYINHDNVTHWATKFMIDGTLNMTQVGGFYNDSFNIGPQGKLVIDPTRFCWRLRAAPTFETGGKLALSSNWASSTNGRFLMCYWDSGDVDIAAANAAFDTTSANGTNPRLYVEQVGTGGRLWLDLNYGVTKPRMNVMCVGDSITQGSDSTYGNWRTPLMKKICANGYEAWSKGYWTIESNDLNNCPLPQEWTHHAGIGGQRLVSGGGGGTIDNIEASLDQAGNVDFVLVKLCTNDINGDGATAERLFPYWTNMVWKVLNQKPHAIFIAGAVVDIAYNSSINARVIAFNNAMKKAIEVDRLFPAKRVYFCDLYTPCYRYDSNNQLIEHMFLSATDLHPDWYGEDRMADAYLATIKTALAEQDASWQLDARETYPATTGAENNVPAAYLNGYTRARVLDVAKHCRDYLYKDGTVPYDDFTGNTAATEDLQRVGYYIELTRKDDSQTEFNGFTRWLWVSVDAFGDRTIDMVGLPLASRAITQGPATNLRIKTNMPGIADTAADAKGVEGWIEFWPNTYNQTACSNLSAPAHTYGYDWNDSLGDGSYGSMQIHRRTPGGHNPAQVLFALNRWTNTDAGRVWEFGLGNFSHILLGSIDWTFTGQESKYMFNTMTPLAFEVAKIEIWTMPYPAVPTTEIESIVQNGTDTEVTVDVKSLGHDAESASLTLEWSTDPNFATVTGSVNLGTVTEAGRVNATVADLATGSQWYFRVTATNDSGTGTEISDPYEIAINVWRPQNASDTWSSTAWKKNGIGELLAITAGWPVFFDGNESAHPASVVVDAPFATDRVTFNASTDYTVTGAGAIAAKTLVKDGSGTLTLDSSAFSQTDDIEVRGGKLKLGGSASTGALGKNGGKVIIKDGGQFDFNYNVNETEGARAGVTRVKTFMIEGDGPDGKGALVNYGSSTYWNNQLNEVVLTGDASIGGTVRINVRNNAKNSVTGPQDSTLTIKNTSENGFNLNNGPLSLGKLVVEQGAGFTAENTLTLTMAEGIDLYGRMLNWGSTLNGTSGKEVLVGRGTAGQMLASSGTSNINIPTRTESGAMLTLAGGGTVNYNRPFDNQGTLVQTAGTHQFKNVLTNQNAITVSGGTFRIDYGSELVNLGNPLIQQSLDTRMYAAKVTGDMRWNVTGGYIWMTGNQDWGDSALEVNLSGAGSIVLGENGQYGLPDFAPGKLTINAANGHTGTVFYHNGYGDTINGPQCTGKVDRFYAQGHTSPAIPHCSTASNLVVYARDFEAGTSNGYCEWTFVGPETRIEADTLTVDAVAGKTFAGSFTFREGELKLNGGGLTTSWRIPYSSQFSMVNGTLKAGADFTLTVPGMTANFGTPVKEGSVVIDLNGHTINWQTGLNGASDVTIRGNGSFSGGRPGIQGIPTGKWTVESTGAVSLRNAAGFPGGLELAEGANVTLDIAGDSMVDLLAWTWSGNAWNRMMELFPFNDIRFNSQHIATSLAYFNRAKSVITDNVHGNGSGFNAFGEFYVSAEEAGQWTFYNKSSTHSGIIIDNTQLSTAGPGSETTSNISLTEGWHRFMVSFYADASHLTIGPVSGEASYFYKNPVVTEYRKFDTTTVQMRRRQEPQARTTARFRSIKTYGDSRSRYQGIQDHEWTSDGALWSLVNQLHTYHSNGVNAPLGGCSARFDGYFYVAKDKAGTWTFNGSYDDDIMLKVDDRHILTSSGNAAVAGSITLQSGWHKFEIRTADNTASGVGNSGSGGYLTDSHGNKTALEFSVNGSAYDSFDERYVPIARQPGESQKVERPGLENVTVAASATLTNDTDEGGYCPIYGTLTAAAGSTVAGPFRFAGDWNSLEVAGVHNQRQVGATFTSPDANMLAGLKELKVVFDQKPVRATYELGNLLGLTTNALNNLSYSCFDAAGNDYTKKVTPTIENGKLILKNRSRIGVIVFVR